MSHHRALRHKDLVTLALPAAGDDGTDLARAWHALENLAELAILEVKALQHPSGVSDDHALTLALLRAWRQHLQRIDRCECRASRRCKHRHREKARLDGAPLCRRGVAQIQSLQLQLHYASCYDVECAVQDDYAAKRPD